MLALVSSFPSFFTPFNIETRLGRGVILFNKKNEKCYWFPQGFKGKITKELLDRVERQSIPVIVHRVFDPPCTHTLYPYRVHLVREIVWRYGALCEVDELKDISSNSRVTDFLRRHLTLSGLDIQRKIVEELLDKDADETLLMTYCQQNMLTNPVVFLSLFEQLIPIIEKRNDISACASSDLYIDLKRAYPLILKMKKNGVQNFLYHVKQIKEKNYGDALTECLINSLIFFAIEEIEEKKSLSLFNEVATFILITPGFRCCSAIESKFSHLKKFVQETPELLDIKFVHNRRFYSRNSVLFRYKHPDFYRNIEGLKVVDLSTLVPNEKGATLAMGRLLGLREHVHLDLRNLYFYRRASEEHQLSENLKDLSREFDYLLADIAFYAAYFENRLDLAVNYIETSFDPKRICERVLGVLIAKLSFEEPEDITNVHKLMHYAKSNFNIIVFQSCSSATQKPEPLLFKLWGVDTILKSTPENIQKLFYDLLSLGEMAFIRSPQMPQVAQMLTPDTLPILLGVAANLHKSHFAKKLSEVLSDKLKEDLDLPDEQRHLCDAFEKYAHLVTIFSWTFSDSLEFIDYVFSRCQRMREIIIETSLTSDVLLRIKSFFPNGIEEIDITDNIHFLNFENAEEREELDNYLYNTLISYSGMGSYHQNLSNMGEVLWLVDPTNLIDDELINDGHR